MTRETRPQVDELQRKLGFQEPRLETNLVVNDVNSRQQSLAFLGKLLLRLAVSQRKAERMVYQDLKQARRECRITLSKWNHDMRRLNGLLHDFDTYTPEAFTASVLEIMPEFQRQTRAFMARMQILLQMLNGGIRSEGDEPGEGANPGAH